MPTKNYEARKAKTEKGSNVEVLAQVLSRSQRIEAKNLCGNHRNQRHTDGQIQVSGSRANPGYNCVGNIAKQQETKDRLAACMRSLNSRRIDLPYGIYTWDDINNVGNNNEDEERSNQREKPFPIDFPGHTLDQPQ